MKNLLKELMEGRQLDADGMKKVATIFSLAYNSNKYGQLQREYDLRKAVLVAMPLDTPLRVYDPKADWCSACVGVDWCGCP